MLDGKGSGSDQVHSVSGPEPISHSMLDSGPDYKTFTDN